MCRIRVSRGTGQRCRESERQRPWIRRRVALADSEQSKRLGIIASPHVGKTPDDDRRPAVVRRRSGHAHPVASDHARALPHDAPWCDPVQRAVDSPTRSPTSVARVHHHGHRHATSPRRSVVVTFTRRPRHQASAGAGRGTRSSPPPSPGAVSRGTGSRVSTARRGADVSAMPSDTAEDLPVTTVPTCRRVLRAALSRRVHAALTVVASESHATIHASILQA